MHAPEYDKGVYAPCNVNYTDCPSHEKNLETKICRRTLPVERVPEAGLQGGIYGVDELTQVAPHA